MPGKDNTVARTLTWVAAALALFVGFLMVLPEPAPPPAAAESADDAAPEVDRDRVKQEAWQQTQAEPTAAPETPLIADFENGVDASFGFGWQVTSDQMQGGSSTARLSAENAALRVEGEIAPGSPFPWAGAIYFPGAQPMQPVDFSDREMLRFRARGDGRTYVVMLFGGGNNAAVPPMAPFTAHAEWSQVEIPLARFPSATPGLIGGLAFVAQPPPLGPFGFEIDDVEIR